MKFYFLQWLECCFLTIDHWKNKSSKMYNISTNFCTTESKFFWRINLMKICPMMEIFQQKCPKSHDNQNRSILYLVAIISTARRVWMAAGGRAWSALCFRSPSRLLLRGAPRREGSSSCWWRTKPTWAWWGCAAGPARPGIFFVWYYFLRINNGVLIKNLLLTTFQIYNMIHDRLKTNVIKL